MSIKKWVVYYLDNINNKIYIKKDLSYTEAIAVYNTARVKDNSKFYLIEEE